MHQNGAFAASVYSVNTSKVHQNGAKIGVFLYFWRFLAIFAISMKQACKIRYFGSIVLGWTVRSECAKAPNSAFADPVDETTFLLV